MKITYRKASLDDAIRQFRYYLTEQSVPSVAVRFRAAVQRTVKKISTHPSIAPSFVLRNTELRGLRSWPVAGFESIRIYFLFADDSMRVIRILHGKRNVRPILERERLSERNE